MTDILREYFWPLFFFACVAIIACVSRLRRKVGRGEEVRRSINETEREA